MNKRQRRRVYLVIAACAVLLWAGGAMAYVVSFRHRNVCPHREHWVARGEDYIGAVVYLCPGGKTVTGGPFP